MQDIEKITHVINYIESRLTDKLDLKDIAWALHFSPFYLHHTFSAVVGLTIHDYLRRRQLTEAAKLLVFSRKSILEIALLTGYETQQSFTKIFKSLYKQTPLEFRKRQLFYPLQLRFEFRGNFETLTNPDCSPLFLAELAANDDIPRWMELVRLVIDGFPFLNEEEYVETLKRYIGRHQALIIKDKEIAVGILLFSPDSGSIDFFGVHPLYRKFNIDRILLDKVIQKLFPDKDSLSITTYREGDSADTGHRKALKTLGFTESELLVEFGYPTQKFLLHCRTSRRS
jgi:AraC-like DNA-binding protein